MLDQLNRYLVFPAYMRWNKDDRISFMKKYEKTQWLSSDELCDRQFQGVQRIVRYAYDNVPFYRKRYDAVGITPEDIRTVEDIRLLPILKKKDLQGSLNDLRSTACPPEQGFLNASGGSTGQPTIFYGDHKSLSSKFGAFLMSDQWTGWNLGEKSAYLWGADRESNQFRSWKEQMVLGYIFRREMLNAFCMSEEDMVAFAKVMLKEKPTLVVAYANAVYQFAEFLKSRGISGICPKGIVSSAETLLEDRRKVVEEVFNCKVLNRYGSREMGLIASECECQQGLHVNTNGIYAELLPLDPDLPGTPSEIVVTDLENQVMPLIRYNTGDTCFEMKTGCACGRGFPLLGSIAGRTSDFIVHPNGNLIHGEYFSHAFYGLPGIVQFQVVQHCLESIDLNVVVNADFEHSNKVRIVGKVQEALGEAVQVNLAFVDSIETPASGKYRFAISHVLSNRGS